MNKWMVTLVACLAVGLIVAGCGSSSKKSSSSTTTTSSGGSSSKTNTSTQPATPSGGTAAGAQVSLQNIQFSPAALTVNKGATVTWTNKDSVGHDVTSSSFKSGGAGGLQQGATFKHTFKKAGTFAYVCTVHPGMKGTITVK